MLIRTSRYVHLINLADNRVVLVHAASQLRLVLDAEAAALVRWFEPGRDMPGEMSGAPKSPASSAETIAGSLAALLDAGVLTQEEPPAEARAFAERLNELHGRDPGAALDRLRLQAKAGAEPYWSVQRPKGLADLGGSAGSSHRVLLFGDCDLQMETDFIAAEAGARGLRFTLAAGFPGDARLAAEQAPDAVIVGALRSRRRVAEADGGGADEPWRIYLEEARAFLTALRETTTAPILLDNLPEPTVQPLGRADRGVGSHRSRFRRLNLELETLAESFEDVFVVDVAAALNQAGSHRLLDDGLLGFSHFGSPGWLLQRPASERRAVHDLFPDPQSLSDALEGDPYGRERCVARAHVDALISALRLDQKKCVIVDLDGTLWPGVLAETGSPFAWAPEISGLYSYIGLYIGLHEALKALKRRGVVLACVSKNDEAVVRSLWRYPDHYPADRLLQLEDFVSIRINWDDKVDNIRQIAEELGFAEDAFVFIDDHPLERARVKAALPKILVAGEDPFALRRFLLTDPRLDPGSLSAEAASRTQLVKRQLQRNQERREAPNADAFTKTLGLVCRFDQPRDEARLGRVAELLARTTQFNTTGEAFALGELRGWAERGEVMTCEASDRFGDHGLVAAALRRGADIRVFVMSCRVIGLGIEQQFLRYVLTTMARDGEPLVQARLIETDRNGPVRHLYRDAGFTRDGEVWSRKLEGGSVYSAA